MLVVLIETAIRITLIAICTSAVLYFLRVKAARARHMVWSGVVVSMLAMPICNAWGPRAVLRVLDRPATPQNSISLGNIASNTDAPIPSPHATRWTLGDLLLALYVLGVLVLSARLVIGTVRAQILRRRAKNLEGILSSDSCAAPITVGWINPAVILPKQWREWPSSQLNAVLIHEGEHARYRDPLVQWLALLNRAIFWFHPLAWWLERRISALAEEACDATVLTRGLDPIEYSEYLLEIARAVQRTGTRISVAGMAMPGTSLPQRVRRILEAAPVQHISWPRAASVTMLFGLISAVFTAGAVDFRPAHQGSPIVTPQVSNTPIVLSSAAPQVQRKAPRLLAQVPTRQTFPAVIPSGSGTISGTVEDPSGARVPNCVITVRNQKDSSLLTAVSDPAGFYRLTVPPGFYSLDFAAPGFSHLTVQAQIEENKSARIDALLDLGKVNEHVTVTAPKPVVAAPSTAKPAPPARIKIGGDVQPMRLISKTAPVYPADLEQQGVEGTVLIRAIISKYGEPLSPHVLNTDVDQRFVQAALDSVRQWRYQPAMLNGEPVETATTITVEFRLGQ